MEKKIETYYYSKVELKKTSNRTINNVNNVTYVTENIVGNIYEPNSTNKAGYISYINNITIVNDGINILPEISFNTSTGTIITQNGKLVYNLTYTINEKPSVEITSSPNENKVISTTPTYVSGAYANYNNVIITIYIVEPENIRLLTIEYN